MKCKVDALMTEISKKGTCYIGFKQQWTRKSSKQKDGNKNRRCIEVGKNLEVLLFVECFEAKINNTA